MNYRLLLLPQRLLLLLLVFLLAVRPDLEIAGAYVSSTVPAGSNTVRDIILFLFSAGSLLWLLPQREFKELSVENRLMTSSLLLCLANCYFQESVMYQTFVLFAVCAVVCAIRNRHFLMDRLFWLFLAYFLWHAVCLTWTPDLDNGLKVVSRYAMFVAVPLVFACSGINKRMCDMVLYAFFRFSMVFLLFALCMWVCLSEALDVDFWKSLEPSKYVINDLPSFKYVMLWSNYQHPTFLSYCYLTGFVAGLSLFKRRPSYIPRISIADVMLYALISLLFVLSEQSRVGLVLWGLVSVLGLIYLIWPSKLRTAAFVAALFAIGTAGYLVFDDDIDRFISDPTRAQLYETTIWLIGKDPIFGVGTGGMELMLNSPETAEAVGFNLSKYLKHPHNQLLCDWLQAGIVGMLLSLSMTVYIFLRSLKARDFILFSFMAIFVVLSVIEEILFNSKTQIIFLLFVCMRIFCTAGTATEEQSENSIPELVQ